MKTSVIFTGLLMGMFLCSCQSNQDEQFDTQVPLSANMVKRSYAEALSIAVDAQKLLNVSSSRSRAVKPRLLDLVSGVKYVTQSRSRSESGLDTLIYVFNYTNNQGFVLVSASKATDGLLAVTEQGHYDPTTGTDNKGLSICMDLAQKYVLSSTNAYMSRIRDSLIFVDTTDTPLIKHRNCRDTLNMIRYIPRINLKWGQTSPEGYLCPNGCSGCGPTAMAMALAYYSYPSTLSLTYPNASVPSISLDWPAIKNHRSTVSGNTDNCTFNTHNQISMLCRQLGHLANSDYSSSDGTGTSPNKIITTLQQLGYSPTAYTDYSSGCLVNNLCNNQIILMCGYDIHKEEGSALGHMWIVDGGYSYKLHCYEQDYKNGLWVTTYDGGISSHCYNHINWGWYGDSNGYYSDGIFYNQNYYKLDDNVSVAAVGFNYTYALRYFTISQPQ